jgi:hypothetical protein
MVFGWMYGDEYAKSRQRKLKTDTSLKRVDMLKNLRDRALFFTLIKQEILFLFG